MSILSNVISTTTKALRSTAANAGRLFLPSDGFSLDRDTGAAWVEWAPLFPVTAPVNGSYSWLNQDAASVDTTNGSIALTTTNVDPQLHIRHLAAPATPYTITAAFLVLLIDTHSRCGLCWDDGTNVHTFGPGFAVANQPLVLASLKWTDVNTFSAAYTPTVTAQPVIGLAQIVWLRIADNGTNRICSISQDGQHWIQFHSVTRTDFLTPTNVGFFIEASDSTSYGSSCTLLHWKQT